MARPPILSLAKRALFLKCPRCGQGRLFRSFFSMHTHCANCRLKYEREQGYFVGAIYVNYGVTVMIAMPGYFVLDYLFGLSLASQLAMWLGFCVLFPLLFFRHSRSLWLGLDYFFNPT